MVAVQLSMLPSASGKAEMPGVVESISCISSACSLQKTSVLDAVRDGGSEVKGLVDHASGRDQSPYLFVTLWVSCLRDEVGSFAASCIVGMPGTEFCVSSMLYAMAGLGKWEDLCFGATQLEDKEKQTNESK